MKTMVLLAVILVVVAAVAFARQSVTRRPASATAASAAAAPGTKDESPLACDRQSMTAQQRKRHFEELGPKLRSLKTGVRELPNGFEFRFPADTKTYQLVTEWAAGERVCCPFFEINLRSEPEGGPLWLRLTGRDGVKQFLQAEGVAWIKP